MALTKQEREEFLAEPHIGALSVAAGADRGPMTVPMWYQYTPGRDVWVMTETSSRKAELIRAAGRYSLMVERSDPSIRYVSVEGAVVGEEPGTEALLREVTERYLAPEKVDGYVESLLHDGGEYVVFRLRPQRWLSADLGVV